MSGVSSQNQWGAYSDPSTSPDTQSKFDPSTGVVSKDTGMSGVSTLKAADPSGVTIAYVHTTQLPVLAAPSRDAVPAPLGKVLDQSMQLGKAYVKIHSTTKDPTITKDPSTDTDTDDTDTDNAAFVSALQTLVKENSPPLTQDEVNAYLANPSDPTIPSGDISLLQSLVQSAKTSVITEFGLDGTWLPTVTSLDTPTPTTPKTPTVTVVSDATVQQAAYDGDFETALQNLAVTDSLTPTQVNQLRIMFYQPPGVTIPTDPTLTSLLSTITANATTAFQTTYGTSTPTPTPDASYYSNVLNGAFITTLAGLVSKNAPPLTVDEVDAYLANPSDPSISASDGALISSLITSATATVVSQFNLDASWQPTVTSLNPVGGASSVAIQNALAGLNNASSLLSLMQDLVNQMADGPDKISAGNYLLHISMQINLLQQQVFASQVVQAQVNTTLANETLSQQTANLAQQATAEAQEAQKSSKMSWMPSWMQNTLKVVSDIALVAMAGVTGPGALVMLPLVAAYIAQPSTATQAFQTISNALGSSAGGQIGSSFICGAICAAMAVQSPTVAMQLFTSNSDSLNNFFLGCGLNSEQAAEAATITTIVVVVITALATIAVGGGGASAAIDAAETAVDTADTAATTADTALQTAQTASDDAEKTLATAQKTADEASQTASDAQAAADADPGDPALQTAATDAQTAAQTALDEADAAASIAQKAKVALQEAQDAADAAQQVAQKAQQALKQAINANKYLQNLKEFCKDVLNFLKAPLTSIKNDPGSAFANLAAACQTITQAISVAQSTMDGVNDYLQAQIVTIQAGSDAATQTADTLIAQLQSAADLFLSAMGDNTTFAASISQAEGELFKAASQIVTALSQAA